MNIRQDVMVSFRQSDVGLVTSSSRSSFLIPPCRSDVGMMIALSGVARPLAAAPKSVGEARRWGKEGTIVR